MRSNAEGRLFGDTITEEYKQTLSVVYNHKKDPILTSTDSFIASQILGDGCLSIRRKTPRKDGSIPMDLAFAHSSKKAGNYTILKWGIAASLGLQPWVLTLDYKGTNRYGGPNLKSGFSIRDQKWLKVGPIEATWMLDAFGLFLWYLDDGCLYPSRSAYLHTSSFDDETVEKIRDILNTKFELNLTIGSAYQKLRDKVYSYLVIPTKSVRELIDLNRDKIKYIPKCMWYKFDMKYRDAGTMSLYQLKELYDFPTE